MSEIATHIVAYIDSHNKLQGTNTHFSHSVNLPKQNNFDSICVLQASIPKSFYLIAPENNTFFLQEFGFAPVTITIPIGNYTRRSFGIKLQVLLNAASPNLYFYQVGVPNTATEPDTGKYNFSVQTSVLNPAIPANAPSLIMEESFQPSESLGFDPYSTNVFFNGNLESTNVCRLQAKNTLFIKSNAVDNGGTGILQALFGADPDFSVINFQVGNAGGIAANRKELIENRCNSLTFVITDEDGLVLDTNGLSVAFSILLWDSSKYNFTNGVVPAQK